MVRVRPKGHTAGHATSALPASYAKGRTKVKPSGRLIMERVHGKIYFRARLLEEHEGDKKYFQDLMKELMEEKEYDSRLRARVSCFVGRPVSVYREVSD